MHIPELTQIVIATSNPGKVREVQDLLSGQYEVEGILNREDLQEVPETGDTFLSNANMKAKGYFEQIGQPTLADDSGLCVDALDGAPGVHSARYAGSGADDRANNRKLLEELRDVPDPERTAYFECFLVFYVTDEVRIVTSGRCRGRIVHKPSGDAGFGYDPLFKPDGYEKTFGELPAEEKNRISHRGRALNRFESFLSELDL